MNRQFKKPYTHRRFVSPKDYSGRRTLKLGAAPVQLPAELLFLTSILNQGNDPKCTAYSAVAIRQSMTGKAYDPELQWQAELRYAGVTQSDGFELKVQLETGKKIGFYPCNLPPTGARMEGFDKAYKYFFL